VQGFLRHRYQSVLVTLGVADMNPHMGGINITNGEFDTLSKAQPHAVGSKEKDPVAQPVGCATQSVELLNRQDVGDPGSLRRFDQGDLFPGFVQYPGVKELQAIEIEFDGTPRMVIQQVMEILKQLLGSEIVDPAIEIVTDTPDRS